MVGPADYFLSLIRTTQTARERKNSPAKKAAVFNATIQRQMLLQECSEPIELRSIISDHQLLEIAEKGTQMADSKKAEQEKREDWPAEKPKKLPADFPKKFDTEQNVQSRKKKLGKGARLHGSM